jgi:hypothetical protein
MYSYSVTEVQQPIQARRKETNMKTNLPLPLELTRPVTMTSDLDTAIAKSYEVENTRYNPETQTRAPEMGGHGGGHNTNSQCVNWGFIQVDDILQDFDL